MCIKHVKRMAWVVMLLFSLAACNKNKVKCSGDSEKDFTLSNFNKIKIGDKFNVLITKGANYSIKAKGCTESIDDLNLSVGSGSTLNVKYKTNNLIHETIDIIITMPELVGLDASGATTATINGMANQTTFLRTELSGASECIVNGTPPEFTFNISGASKLEITGTTNIYNGQLSGASHLKSYGLAAKQTDIDASGASEAYVTAQDKLYAEASGASTIYYKGNPPTLYINTSGSSKVIKQ